MTAEERLLVALDVEALADADRLLDRLAGRVGACKIGAQLFTAAGLMEVRLVPLTLAFFAGRMVSYTIYVTGAAAIKESFGSAVVDSLTSPIGIALQVVALAALVALLRVDWTRVLSGAATRGRGGSGDP